MAIKFHHDLVEHFKNHDAEAAAKTMRDHLEHAEEHVIQYYKSIGFNDYREA